MFMITLEAARVNAGLRQKEAADRLGINVGTLSNWERGLTSPDIDKFKEMCDLYNCPSDIIFLRKRFT